MQINKKKLKSLLPRYLLSIYRTARQSIHKYKYQGDRYFCNVCISHLSEWNFAGPVGHKNFVCPVCNSYGRHRMMVMVLNDELQKNEKFFDGKILHFAPEIGLKGWIRSNLPYTIYQSADLTSSEADLQIDLQRIALPNNSINAVILSHVLEHVENDALALNEIKRILRPGGKLFLQVPLGKNKITIDDHLDLEAQRIVRYGQSDHVRLYGDDFINKLISTGFIVTVHLAEDEPYASHFSKMALDLPHDSTMLYKNESTTFVCLKPI